MVADTLSRRVHEIHAITIRIYKLDFCDRILEVSRSNLHYVDIKAKLQQGMSQHNLKVMS
jgi:hypothetical protein